MPMGQTDGLTPDHYIMLSARCSQRHMHIKNTHKLILKESKFLHYETGSGLSVAF